MEAVLDHLRDTDIRNSIYYDSNKELVGGNIDEKLDPHGLIKREAARRKLYGIYTQGKSREQMFGLLEGHIKEHKDKFVGKYLINDIMSLIRTKTGKIVAGPGMHDDSVMSYLMCLYMYYYGNNLQRFGFIKGLLPDEQDRNQGMNYAELFDSLSDADKQFFDGYSVPTEVANLDMETMITENRGLITPKELEKSLNKDTVKPVRKPVITDEYTLKVMKEMERAQQESERFNRRIKFKNSYENTDYDETSSDGDMSLFDELNDF